MDDLKRALSKIAPFFICFLMIVSSYLLYKDYEKAVELLLGAIGIFK